MTTDGTGYDTKTLYKVTGISGTANGSPIVGLWITNFPSPNELYTPDNQFRWNGGTGIVIERLDLNQSILSGIAFSNSASHLNFIYTGGNGSLYNYFSSTSGGNANSASVSSSSITPVPWETDALPVIGSTVLFGLGLWAKQKFAKPLQK